MTKINKASARKLYNQGITIHVLPCKVGLDSMWIIPYTMNIKDIRENGSTEFDIRINAFEFYNCNRECGRYSAFYID